MSMIEAAALMRTHHGRALVVETGDDWPAIFTEYDVVKVVANGDSLQGKTVGEHHTAIAVAATPDWSLERAVETMLQGQFRHLVVVENGRTVGMLAMRDILEAVMDKGRVEAAGEREVSMDETVELGSHVGEDASHLIHNLRRGAKQHFAAIQCPCELDWIEVVMGQAEERHDLSTQEIEALWNLRQPCPALYEGGGAD